MNNSNRHHSRLVMAVVAMGFCLVVGPICTHAQQGKEHWERVYTGEGSIIEFNSSSSRFEANNVLRADFRTVLSKAESISGQPGVKYKTRLETIDFKLTQRRYQFFEIALLDSGGKVIQKRNAAASDEWRVVKPGGITERLFDVACNTTPLGEWKVMSYRFAEGDAKGAKSNPELDKFIGVVVHLEFDLAEVGDQVCRSPSFQDRDLSQDESLRQLGIDWKSIGIKTESARTIAVKCHDDGWQPSHSLLVKDDTNEMLMLWNGVFLVLKRTSGSGYHAIGYPTLKRVTPQKP